MGVTSLLRQLLMKQIALAFVAVILLLSGLWLLADTLWPEPFSYFAFRSVFVQYSGVLAMGLMSVAMILAARPARLEPYLNGLDKMYRLHKWLGITALAIAVAHWWMAQGSKWMVSWGWLERPQRGPRPGGETPGMLEAWFRSQRGLAESIGEWAFYAVVILLLLALIKRFPYHRFVKTHKLMAPLYLLLVFHTVILVKLDYWSQPVGWALALLLAAGVVSAFRSLFGRIGAGRRVSGRVRDMAFYPKLRVLETAIELDGGWPGHRAGQFAFVTSDHKEGAHPYTIASAWDPAQRCLVFVTKALGDHTARLPERLQPGMPVEVEGPYGCFDFDDDRPRQIWVGAGIGITPFIARLKALAREPGAKAIDLFHPTSDIDPEALQKLQADADAAGVRLHLWLGSRDGRLSGDSIRALVPDWASASVWFCGPAAFGQALRTDFLKHGLKDRDFHRELFQMR